MSARRILALALAAPALAGAAPVRVLLLTGQNNHDWKATTPILVKQLEATGRFQVEVTEHPEQLDPASWVKHDVLLSHWNTFGAKSAVNEWPEALCAAYVAFVRNGGGHVALHAGSSGFYDWADYQAICLATWKNGQTGHGPAHIFEVRPAPQGHPVTRGLAPFSTYDELWNRPGVQPGAQVVLESFSRAERGGTGAWEPCALAGTFGKGRCFTLLLGHDVAAMEHPLFAPLLARGLEWAATGEVTVPLPPISRAGAALSQAIRRAKDYRYGGDRAVLLDLERLTAAAAAAPETRREAAELLTGSLAPDATPEARAFFCDNLGLVADADALPALAKASAEDALLIHAVGAIERVGGKEAAAALRDLAAHATGSRRLALIRALGHVGDESSVEFLGVLLAGADVEAARAATDALGAIGGRGAVAQLLAHPGRDRAAWGRALVAAADAPERKADTRELAAALRELQGDAKLPAAVRTSAFLALAARDAGAVAVALEGRDEPLRSAALAFAAGKPEAASLAAVAKVLPTLSPPLQVQALHALAAGGTKDAMGSVTNLLASGDPAVRGAAAEALSAIGGADAAAALLAWKTGGDEVTVRRRALQELRGSGVDAILLRRLEAAAGDEAAELIGILGDRGAASARPALEKIAAGGSAELLAPAAKALERVGDASSCRVLIAAMENASGPGLAASRRAIGAIGLRIPEGAAPVLAALPAAPEATRVALIGILPAIGGKDAAAALADMVRSGPAPVQRAALEALGDWKTAEPLETLLAVAEGPGDQTVRSLAARGAARLLKHAAGNPAAFAGQLGRVIKAAPGPADVKAALGAAAAVPSAEVLAVVLGCARNPAYANEAAAAVAAIAPQIPAAQKRAAARAVREALAGADGASRDGLLAALFAFDPPPNLARGAVAESPDGLEKDGDASGDAAAIDGDPATYWDEANDQKEYRLRVTLAKPARLLALSILGWKQHSFAPKDFDVLLDGRKVREVREAQYAENRLFVALPACTGRVVELVITGYYPQSPAIRELEVYGEPLGGTTSAISTRARVAAVVVDTSPEARATQITAPATPTAAPAELWSWRKSERGLELRQGEQVVWGFHADGAAKPYFHPLALPGGPVLTGKSPPDHPWHLGLWFAWKYIDGTNYWEEDKKTGKSAGRTEVADCRIEAGDDFSAQIDLALNYRPAEGAPAVLAEKRVVKVSSPGRDGGYTLDWTAEFTAGPAGAVLDAAPPNRYAGLGVRFAAGWTNGTVSAPVPTGEWKDNRLKFRAGAADFSAVLDGRPVGLALLDHPGNRGSPTPWYVVQDAKVPFAFLMPSPLQAEPIRLGAGEKMSLRYRILVHPGSWKAARLEREGKAWAAEKEDGR